jgi:hypothetical protein
MIKKCVICNSEFEAKRADAEVCSAACRQKNWRLKAQKQSDPKDLASKINLKAPPQGPEAYDAERIDIASDELDSFAKARILEPWIQKIRDYCLKNGLQPDEIPAKMDEMKIEIKRLMLLKDHKKPSDKTTLLQGERKILNASADKTKQMVEPEPGTPAWYIRHGG